MFFKRMIVPDREHSKTNQNLNERGRTNNLQVNVTFLFLIISITLSAALAFTIGWATHLIFLARFGYFVNFQSAIHSDGNLVNVEIHTIGKREDGAQLPSPKVIPGKEVPPTIYTSKNFNTAASVRSSTLLLDRSESNEVKNIKEIEETQDAENSEETEDAGTSEEVENIMRNGIFISTPSANNPNSTLLPISTEDPHEYKKEKAEEDDLHLPAGQHLLVDIKNVDASFLDSETRLAHAMIELVNESKLTLLSYHCHSLIPNGVSCAGVLLESHVAFHTWPSEGVITLDLFTCGSNPLVPVLPSIERLFAVPQSRDEANESGEDDIEGENVPQPAMIWAHKLRGFREGSAQINPLDQDLGRFVLGKLDFDKKEELVSTETDFQRVDVYELIHPRFRSLESYEKSLSDDGSYESKHPELYLPNRILFLDGVLQSTLYGDAPYHESIVHPAMISHPHPKRVAIIGGGEGATLREVLKHKTVEEAVMIEIDEEIVLLSQKYLPQWSDCSNIVGSAEWCFDDERVTLKSLDAMAWFTSNFGRGKVNATHATDDAEEPFDVIIMDALDPDVDIEFAMDLYQNDAHIEALYNALTESGVLAVQLGQAPEGVDPADEVGTLVNRVKMMKKLDEVGFQSMHIFEESHSEMTMPWSTLVAFKNYQTRANWYRNSAEIEVQLHQRILTTPRNESTLRYFDGSTMMGYQMPHKTYENIYCRQENTPQNCEFRGIDPALKSLPMSHVEVKMSQVGGHSGRGVFARYDIPKNAVIGMKEHTTVLHVNPSTWSIIEGFVEKATREEFMELEDAMDPIETYVVGYGFSSTILGQPHYQVDSTLLTFVNHGCNQTFNYGDDTPLSEMDADIDHFPEILDFETRGYNPVAERHQRQVMTIGDAALRDIKEGEEILSNYLDFVGDSRWWKDDVLLLQNMCRGMDVGEVTEYESEKDL